MKRQRRRSSNFFYRLSRLYTERPVKRLILSDFIWPRTCWEQLFHFPSNKRNMLELDHQSKDECHLNDWDVSRLLQEDGSRCSPEINDVGYSNLEEVRKIVSCGPKCSRFNLMSFTSVIITITTLLSNYRWKCYQHRLDAEEAKEHELDYIEPNKELLWTSCFTGHAESSYLFSHRCQISRTCISYDRNEKCKSIMLKI